MPAYCTARRHANTAAWSHDPCYIATLPNITRLFSRRQENAAQGDGQRGWLLLSGGADKHHFVPHDAQLAGRLTEVTAH